MKNIKLEFNLPISIIKEGKSYIAYTPALDLSTSAENYEQAKKRFSEIVNIFFEEIIKKGTLENVLGDLGWRKI
jgi:D-aminopeptidase